MGRKEKIVSLENNNQHPIGARMRLARIEKGFRLTDMSEAIGYTKSRLSTVENGYGNPSQELIQAYEQQLGLEPGALMRVQEGVSPYIPGRRHSALPTYISSIETTKTQEQSSLPATRSYLKDAPQKEVFYGREQELAVLEHWIQAEHSRVVTLLGIGGIGKTTLASIITERVKEQFTYVFWYTLQNAPLLEEVLRECLQFLSGQAQTVVDSSEDTDEQMKQLVEYLQKYRCLLVLDNVETILESSQNVGQYRAGYESYGKLITTIGENIHQSCLLLTSRELPTEVVHTEGNSVKVLSLTGVGLEEGRRLLRGKDLLGSNEVCDELTITYGGNPLALKLVAAPIKELFGGEIAEFLAERGTVVGDIYALIDAQFHRLSIQEREIIYWFALACEPISFNDVLKKIVRPVPKRDLLNALDSLRRRSMIENSSGTYFTLQPVIMEYVTEEFVASVCKEIEHEQFALLLSHTLIRAEAKDHIRNNQTRLFLEAIIRQLLSTLGKVECEAKLKSMLAILKETRPDTPEYAAGNLLNLLVQLKVDLAGYDFSHLAVWNGYLQNVNLHKVNFSYSELKQTVFSDTFGSVLSVALSPDGTLLAAGTANGEVRLWDVQSGVPLGICQGHTDWVRSVAFSPDGSSVLSGSDDQSIRLWDVKTTQCLKIFYGHTNRVRSVAFAPNGTLAASGGDDHTVRVWDIRTAECLHTLEGHTSRVWSVAFGCESDIVVSGSHDRAMKLWNVQDGVCIKTFLGHKDAICSVAFSADGKYLASSGDDQIVYLWDREKDAPIQLLRGHTSRIWSMTFSLDGNLLASGSDDQTIRLWDVHSGETLTTLRGHTNRVWSVAFHPISNILVSGSDDQSIRMWNTDDGQCVKTIQGHSSRIRSIAFSPDGNTLISGSDDRTVRLWQVETGQCLKILQGHSTWIYSVAFSPTGAILASGSDDQTIRLWDVKTGYCLRTLGGHTNWVRSIAFSPDGTLLVSGSDDQTVRLWQVSTGLCLGILQKDCSRIWSVAFSPDGKTIACGGEDKIVRLWQLHEDASLRLLHDHTGRVRSVAFSPDGHFLASSSDDRTIRLWEVSTGRCVSVLRGHMSWIWSVAFSSDGKSLVSGGDDQSVRFWELDTQQQRWAGYEHSKRVYSVAFRPDASLVASGSYDGTIKLWDVASGTCVRTLRRERPYEQMNITGVTGLSSAQKVMLRTLGAIEDE